MSADAYSELLEVVDEQDAEIAELRAAIASAAPIVGGPPAAWDAWIMALPNDVFLACLGPSEAATQLPPPPRAGADMSAPVSPSRASRSARALVPNW